MGGQGLYLRSFDHLGRSSEDKDRKNPKKGKCDGLTDGQTDGPTKRGVESRSTRPKTIQNFKKFVTNLPTDTARCSRLSATKNILRSETPILFFSRVLRDSTTRFVGRSVRPSVRHTLLFYYTLSYF